MEIHLNSSSSGNFREEVINGRTHLITEMVSIELNSIMNGLFYPKEAIEASYHQLDNLPAPMGHPVVNGENVSANHPLAVNAFNVGAFVMNPRIEGNFVHNDLAIDIMTAEKDSRGIELMKRIKNKERVGVSTGLNAGIMNGSGERGGVSFNGTVSGIEFDHVANLLHEAPAGQNTYTVNSDNENSVLICNVEQSTEQKPTAVTPIQTNQEGEKSMDKDKLILSIIANSGNTLTESDQAALSGMSEMGLVAKIHNSAVAPEAGSVSVDEAVSVVETGGMFAINADEKALLDGLKTAETEKREKMVNAIIANSEMSKDDLAGMGVVALENMAKSVKAPATDYSVQGASVTNSDSAAPADYKLPEGA